MQETPKKSYVSVENYDDIRDITSPRTKRACGRLGIPVSALIKEGLPEVQAASKNMNPEKIN
jgi:hypothetical protein